MVVESKQSFQQIKKLGKQKFQKLKIKRLFHNGIELKNNQKNEIITFAEDDEIYFSSGGNYSGPKIKITNETEVETIIEKRQNVDEQIQSTIYRSC
jgi:hypothetical protein